MARTTKQRLSGEELEMLRAFRVLPASRQLLVLKVLCAASAGGPSGDHAHGLILHPAAPPSRQEQGSNRRPGGRPGQ